MQRCFTAWRAVVPLLAVGLSLSGCVTRSAQQSPQQEEPHWVRRGEGVFWDQAALYAVGISDTSGRQTDARPVKILKREADQHARTQVAMTLVSYVDQLFQEAAFGSNDAAESEDELQAIQAAIFPEGTVHRWIDPFSGEAYSLFRRIDRRRIVGAMTTGQRDEADRRRMAAQADAVFERLRRQGTPWR